MFEFGHNHNEVGIAMELRNIYIGILLVATTLSGCTTLNDVVSAKESGKEGTAQTYHVSENKAWDIAKTVFRWEGSDAIEEHRDQRYMLTSSGMNLMSAGTVMGAWVEPCRCRQYQSHRRDQTPNSNKSRNDVD